MKSCTIYYVSRKNLEVYKSQSTVLCVGLAQNLSEKFLFVAIDNKHKDLPKSEQILKAFACGNLLFVLQRLTMLKYNMVSYSKSAQEHVPQIPTYKKEAPIKREKEYPEYFKVDERNFYMINVDGDRNLVKQKAGSRVQDNGDKLWKLVLWQENEGKF